MFKDEFLDTIFTHKEMQTIPVGCQSTAVHVFEDILEKMMEVNPYATVSELFTTADDESVPG